MRQKLEECIKCSSVYTGHCEYCACCDIIKLRNIEKEIDLSDPNSVESPETKSEDKSLSLIESMKKMEDGFKIVYFAKGSSYMIERLPIPDGGIYRPPVGDYILISE